MTYGSRNSVIGISSRLFTKYNLEVILEDLHQIIAKASAIPGFVAITQGIFDKSQADGESETDNDSEVEEDYEVGY